MPFKHRHSDLNIRCSSINGNLAYAGRFRSFSNSSRSEERVVGKCIDNTLVIYKPKACEVLQLDSNYTRAAFAALKLFKLYEKRIGKASKKVQKTFTPFNITCAYIEFYCLTETAKNYTKGVGALKLPLYQNLCDPCFLLIVYSSLKNKKATGVDDVPLENVTLASIISLSLELQIRKYSPNPTKRIFIPKANGKMRPLGIASSKDKIVQQALKLILDALFENVFLDSSHGFRKNRSCHTALKLIYYRWRGVKWFIECDFVQCFDRISHPIFLSIFNEYVDDYWTSILISRFMKRVTFILVTCVIALLNLKWAHHKGQSLVL
jgi:hypothetical protein